MAWDQVSRPLAVQRNDLVTGGHAGLGGNTRDFANHRPGFGRADHEHDPERQYRKDQVEDRPGRDDGDALTHRFGVEGLLAFRRLTSPSRSSSILT